MGWKCSKKVVVCLLSGIYYWKRFRRHILCFDGCQKLHGPHHGHHWTPAAAESSCGWARTLVVVHLAFPIWSMCGYLIENTATGEIYLQTTKSNVSLAGWIVLCWERTFTQVDSDSGTEQGQYSVIPRYKSAHIHFFFIFSWQEPIEKKIIVIKGYNFGFIIGPPLAGIVNTYLGWKWNFYINGGLALAVTVLWVVLICETPQESKRISSEELDYIITNTIVGKMEGEVLPKVPPYLDIIMSIKVWALV